MLGGGSGKIKRERSESHEDGPHEHGGSSLRGRAT
jgi:hypothetical protein